MLKRKTHGKSASGIPLIFAFAAILPLACSTGTEPGGGPPEQITTLPRDLTSGEEQVITESRGFGFALLRETDARKDGPYSNTVLSPLSASMSLGMALVGAGGETFEGMRHALSFEGMTREEIYASYRGLLDLLPNLDPDVEIHLANSAWSRQDFPFLPSYFDAVTQQFNAEVRELDFADPTAKDVINQWVEENTGGHIQEIIEEVRPTDILFLINALYFQGDWTTQFRKADTRARPFHLPDGTVVEVPTMSGDIPFAGIRWLESGGMVGELPYGGRAFGMVLVVPGPEETVDDLLAELDEATWNEWVGALSTQEASVRLPKMEMEWEGLLNDPLKALGMEVAFKPAQADFSRLSNVPFLYISTVRQKTYMKMDEEGTEAAAATSTGMATTSAPPSIVVDRPFILAIRERLSGAVLFLGVVRDPR